MESNRHPCDGKGPEVTAYVTGNLDAAARAVLEAHMTSCSACRDSERSIRDVWALMATLPMETVPHVVRRGLKATIAAERSAVAMWPVVVETLLALGLLTMLGVVCPIPMVCEFFHTVVQPLLGERFTFLAHTMAAAMMGLLPLVSAELLTGRLASPPTTQRRQLVGMGYFALVAVGVPLLRILPPDPVAVVSWCAGAAAAAWLSMEIAEKLQPAAVSS
ncbi:MAG: zf-HC2 domain-containing protein [Candidatus Wallbacteria bacterium]|nr:zf-HC2 domain-containing protein [Candidatus Wallbacteria bacterium]